LPGELHEVCVSAPPNPSPSRSRYQTVGLLQPPASVVVPPSVPPQAPPPASAPPPVEEAGKNQGTQVMT
jgi:hypothetical protein